MSNINRIINKKIIALISLSLLTFLLSLSFFSYLLFTFNQDLEDNTNIYTAHQVIVLVNKERKKYNLPDLFFNQDLTMASENKLKDLKEKKYFSHINPNGKKWSDFIEESDYNYQIIGENLANGFVEIQLMVDSWMNSPTHKENIINPLFEETGVAVGVGNLNNTPTIFVVQMFGKAKSL